MYMIHRIRPALVLFALCLTTLLGACTFPGQQPAQKPDPRLQVFHILSSRIIILDTQAEVDGNLQNVGQNRFPFDVTIEATFYDSAGNVVGQAQGVAEDVFPGMTRPFTLLGQVDSLHYSHMQLTPVSLRERRSEKLLPTSPPIVP
jgi:hypothetical protein